ncbi:hypothetical protein IJ843_07735 [bacterium]|nr:hypothetical protein [bacterium]
MLENLEKIVDFKYGENRQQAASLYKNESSIDWEILNGGEFTYRNYLDMTMLVEILGEFFDVFATALTKSGLICGVALGKTLVDSYAKSVDCNPVGAIGACVGFSKIVDERTAKKIAQSQFELVLATGFDKEALEILKKNETLKIVKINTPLEEIKISVSQELKITPFGVLEQDSDRSDFKKDSFKVQTQKKPEQEQLEDAIFAFKVAKYAKSNAVVLAKDFKTIAIGQGETSFAEACQAAMDYACDSTKDAVLATDSAISTIDIIHAAARGRIALIIQSGGTVNDKKITDQCDRYEIAMVTTGIEHFKS